MGWLVQLQGDIDRAKAAAREGLKLSDEAGLGDALKAKFLRLSGRLAMLQGDYERAKDLFEESLTLSRDADDMWGIADALFGLGATLICLDDRKRAKELQEEGVVLARELGYVSTLTRFLFSLGYTLLLEGDYERGAALNEEAAALTREHGYVGGGGFVLHNPGWASLLRGDHERAKTSYEGGLALYKELGEKMLATESLEGLACVAGTEGEAERAARLFGAAEALREALGVRLEPDLRTLQEPYLVRARSQLEEGAWTKAWEEGRAMSMERAVEYALSEEKPTPPISPAPERSPADESPDLTPREREVAILVARGLTNHQIAQELVLSEHTVITHVRNILKKLNLRSRTQLTLWVTEQQPHP